MLLRRKTAYLDDLQLHALVGLRPLETGADGLDDPVDELLSRGGAVRGAARQVAVRYQLLQVTHIHPYRHIYMYKQKLCMMPNVTIWTASIN